MLQVKTLYTWSTREMPLIVFVCDLCMKQMLPVKEAREETKLKLRPVAPDSEPAQKQLLAPRKWNASGQLRKRNYGKGGMGNKVSGLTSRGAGSWTGLSPGWTLELVQLQTGEQDFQSHTLHCQWHKICVAVGRSSNSLNSRSLPHKMKLKIQISLID